MHVFLPYRAEFGYMVSHHGPQVNAVAVKGFKVVVCEPGYEALYPTATHYFHCDPRPTDQRRKWFEEPLLRQWSDRMRSVAPGATQVRPSWDDATKRLPFVPEPYEEIQRGPFPAPVVAISPRARRYGEAKNWRHWESLGNMLEQAGVAVAAIGSGESSGTTNWPFEAASRYKRPLDASLAILADVRVVVATDSGSAHLALMCGKPLVLITHLDGLTAPGYGKIKFDWLDSDNHMHAPIRVVRKGWTDARAAYEATLSLLEETYRI